MLALFDIENTLKNKKCVCIAKFRKFIAHLLQNIRVHMFVSNKKGKNEKNKSNILNICTYNDNICT